MSLAKYFGVTQAVEGNMIPNCAVFVYAHGTLTKSTLYDDLEAVIPNPTYSDVAGQFQFKIVPGIYDYHIVPNEGNPAIFNGVTMGGGVVADSSLTNNHVVVASGASSLKEFSDFTYDGTTFVFKNMSVEGPRVTVAKLGDPDQRIYVGSYNYIGTESTPYHCAIHFVDSPTQTHQYAIGLGQPGSSSPISIFMQFNIFKAFVHDWRTYMTLGSDGHVTIGDGVVEDITHRLNVYGTGLFKDQLDLFQENTSTTAHMKLTPKSGPPSVLQDGMVWMQSDGLYYRIGGVTVGPLS